MNVDLSVDKQILFIAYVINCTAQVKHKTEKIKIIVKGAEKVLTVKDLSWEQINKKLESDGKPGTSGEKLTIPQETWLKSILAFEMKGYDNIRREREDSNGRLYNICKTRFSV